MSGPPRRPGADDLPRGRRWLLRAATVVALVGPLLVGVAVVHATANPDGPGLGAGAAIALAVLLADALLVVRRRRRTGVAALLTHAALGLFLTTYCASPLPRPAPFDGELPAAAPPAGMAVFQLPTGLIHRTAAFAYRGGSPLERRDFAMAAALVTHPRGDILIDTGFGRDLDAQIQRMPLAFRAATSYVRGATALEQLTAAGHDRARLAAILLTHAHWDHVSGVPDFPGVPVLVTREERRFIADGGWITAVARAAGAPRYQEYAFEGGPYLGFARSHDVHGDGSIVVVPAPGHTPGSVIVFVAVPDGTRYAFVGDLVWQREGITERAERPWAVRRLADDDPDAVRATIARMAALVARFPQLVVVPAHDQRGYASLPRL